MNSEVQLSIVVLVLVLYIVVGHLVDELHNKRKTSTHPSLLDAQPHHRAPVYVAIHESAPAIIVGLVIGMCCSYFYNTKTAFIFDEHVFFTFVLPPIIFSQGYSLKKRKFFKYFGYILTFGLIGTLIQFLIMAAILYTVISSGLVHIQQDGVAISLSLHECVIMAAVLSASDEVATLSLIKQSEHPKLSAIMFGEGVLNDALSVLLFRSAQQSEESLAANDSALAALGILSGRALYLCITAAVLGVGGGLIFSRLLKVMTSMKPYPVRQTAIVMLGGYLSFTVAEGLQLSGILTVFFAGVTLSHYAWHSLSEEAKISTKVTFQTMSAIAEGYCFAAMGLSLQSFQYTQWSPNLIAITMGTLVIGRTVTVFGLCFIGWILVRRKFYLPLPEQIILCMGGVVRGAIGWAQVQQVHDKHRGIIVTTAIAVVLVTVLLFSFLIPTTLSSMDLESDKHNQEKQYEPLTTTPQNETSNGYGSIDPSAEFDGVEEVDRVHLQRLATERPALLRRLTEDLQEDTNLHRLWRHFDSKFMRPVFCADVPVKIVVHRESEVVQTRIPVFHNTVSVQQQGDEVKTCENSFRA